MTKSRFVLSLVLALCIATVASAQDETKKKNKKKKGDPAAKLVTSLTKQMMKTFDAVSLTDEQKEKATAIIKEHAPSFSEAKKAVDTLLSDEQKTARSDAQKKARADGIKGKEAAKALQAALKMSDEDLAAFKEASKKPQAVNSKIRKAIAALLTDEQKALMPQKGKGKGKGKKKMAEVADTGVQTVSLKLPNMT